MPAASHAPDDPSIDVGAVGLDAGGDAPDGQSAAMDTLAAESLFLSALLWARAGDPALAPIVALVRAEDFYGATHAELYSIITTLVGGGPGVAHDPASVLAELRRRGHLTGTSGQRLATALRDAATAGADGIQTRHYAAIVVGDAYRRTYRAVADGLAHAADALPEDQLWPYICHHGCALRDHRARLSALRATDLADVSSDPDH